MTATFRLKGDTSRSVSDYIFDHRLSLISKTNSKLEMEAFPLQFYRQGLARLIMIFSDYPLPHKFRSIDSCQEKPLD